MSAMKRASFPKRNTRKQATKNRIETMTTLEKCEHLYQSIEKRNINAIIEYLSGGAISDYVSLESNMGYNCYHMALPSYQTNTNREQETCSPHLKKPLRKFGQARAHESQARPSI